VSRRVPRCDRRAFVAAAGALLGATVFPALASAMGRIPLGGRCSMHVPWPTSSIDPHDLRDPAAALFASAIADSVYGLDAAGNPYPTLAAALPSREGDTAVVRLREGMRTARLAPLDGRDLISSVERARARGAVAVLADIPRPVRHAKDPLAAVFPGADPGRLARALASPMVALLPRTFNAAAPDGTGAFRADPGPARLLLMRNASAARGPAFLDAIEVVRSESLMTSLRAFEAERDDLGWLGVGLHANRRGAVRFDLGVAAWIVLATSPDAGLFGQPGVAQRLVDALPPERLAHLALGALPPAQGDPAWGGPPAELLVDEAAAHLVEIAEAIAPILSRPGHEVTSTPVPRTELARRRARGLLTLDLVRPLGPGPFHALLALATADDRARAVDLARHPPRLGPDATWRSLTSTLRLGVIAEVRIAGGVAPEIGLSRAASGDGWDLGATFRRPVKR
jgi:peptide/nickel transport system substrate-binding protein